MPFLCFAKDPCKLASACQKHAKCTTEEDKRGDKMYLKAVCKCYVECTNDTDETVVCGTDGKNWQNQCELEKVACENITNVVVAYGGSCSKYKYLII